MIFPRLAAVAVAIPALFAAHPALAENDEDAELWFGPSIEKEIDGDTSIELQTAQRFRDGSRRRGDTFYFRGWVHQKVADRVTISGAVEQRFNSRGNNENRFIQQVQTRHGIFRTRLRLEERFVENQNGRMGVRLRPRLSLRIPMGDNSRVTTALDGELFYTIRATSDGGSNGLTGAETRVGFTYKASDNVDLGLKYVRAQSLRSGRPDTVGHAPLVELGISF